MKRQLPSPPLQPLPLFEDEPFHIAGTYSPDAAATLFLGDRLHLLASIPSGTARLVVTSPPYNIGKKYEKRVTLEEYLSGQRDTIEECYRILAYNGSICWQVGNHVDEKGEIYPLDTLLYPIFKEFRLKLRNRIIWSFEHGLHCSKRLSGRYETIAWFTKSDQYVFDLDAVRVPQKYPGKRYFKGPKIGQYSSNPLGKNPGDVWVIPNVKHNHAEKTIHPCQFPIELIERLVLAMTSPGDLVVDPYVGVGTTACAAVLHKRRAAGADLVPQYIEVARERVMLAHQGRLLRRPMERPIYEPDIKSKVAQRPLEWSHLNEDSPQRDETNHTS